MVRVNPLLHPAECTPSTATTDVFNVCAVKLLKSTPQTAVIAVYLPPSSRVSDTSNLIVVLSSIIKRSTSFLILGDFNIVTDWSVQHLSFCSGVASELVKFMHDFNLRQLKKEPSRLANTLDIVLVSPRLYESEVSQLLPFGGSDHMTQVVKFVMSGLQAVSASSCSNRKVDFCTLKSLLRVTDWHSVFCNCVNVDDFAEAFDSELQECISKLSRWRHKRESQECDLLRPIVKLIHKKRAAWR